MVTTETLKNIKITIDPKHIVMYDKKSQKEIRDKKKTVNSIRTNKDKSNSKASGETFSLLPYLKKHRELCSESSTYIFETRLGDPFITCDKISSHYWKPVLEQLGMTYRNLYQMRHSFASLMISSGEDILWVSNMLGHKDSSMTLEVYTKYVKQSDRKRAVFLSK
jgi:integrase